MEEDTRTPLQVYQAETAPLRKFKNANFRVAPSQVHGDGLLANQKFYKDKVLSGGGVDEVGGVWAATLANASKTLDLTGITNTKDLHEYLRSSYYPTAIDAANVDIIAGSRAFGGQKSFVTTRYVKKDTELLRVYSAIEWGAAGAGGLYVGMGEDEVALMRSYLKELRAGVIGGGKKALPYDKWYLENPLVDF